MKIVQIVPSFQMGGAEKVVLDYILEAKKNNVEMMAISLAGKSQSIYDQIIEENGLNVVYLNKHRGFSIKAVLKLRRLIKELDPEVVHTHLNGLFYYLLSGTWRLRKSFYTIHSYPEKDAVGIHFLIYRFAFRRRIVMPIALNETMRKKSNIYYGIQHTIVLENGIDYKRFRAGNGKRIRDEYNLNNKYVIGHVGRFNQAKNHKFILDVFETVKQRNDNARLLLGGDGELRTIIEEDVKRRGLEKDVIFLGNRDDIPDVLDAMDVFLFPSLYEGFPLAALEAQVAGKKCVVSDAVSKDIVISDGITFLDLNAPKEMWVDEVLSNNYRYNLNEDADKFDLNNIIKSLLGVYYNNQSLYDV